MSELLSLSNPVFVDFIYYAVIVLVKLLAMSVLTVLRRMSTGAFVNPEDIVNFYKGKDPAKKKANYDERVERVRRNHLNDLENIPVFILIGFFYVLTSPTPHVALWHFRLFGISKLLHTVSYQRSLQPWRALLHTVGFIVSLSMAWRVFQAVM